MPKFFVTAEEIRDRRILLGERNTAHIKALRLRQGEAISVSDGRGREFECRYCGMENGVGVAEVLSAETCETEPSVKVTLYVSMPKGDKAELILQKAVELGAVRVCFFLSSRSVSRPEESAVRKRLDRFTRISEEAAMQSGRGIVPQVVWLPDFRTMAEDAAQNELALFLWEEAEGESLRTAIQRLENPPATIALISGPEGGFSGEEADQAACSGLLPVTLGRRILRCETAPICALSAVMYATGNLE